MSFPSNAQRILWYESIGFAGVIALSWLDESLNLPGLLSGASKVPDWWESLIETVVALAVWLVVVVFTRRLLGRLRYLEGFVKMCAWCRKVDHDGEWISVEAFFAQKLDVRTTHGMCPECARKAVEGTG